MSDLNYRAIKTTLEDLVARSASIDFSHYFSSGVDEDGHRVDQNFTVCRIVYYDRDTRIGTESDFTPGTSPVKMIIDTLTQLRKITDETEKPESPTEEEGAD